MTTVPHDRLTRLTPLTRLTRWYTTIQRLTATVAIAVFCHLSAAAASAAPLGDLEDKLGDLTDKIATYGRGFALLAFVIIFISWIAEPIIPQWARENKGIIARVLMGCIGIGLVPDIVAFVFD
ncbi:MAG TPA: hypothetical protein VFZ66_19065 [Herpetosiphonaceae bacterium]